MLPPDCHAAPAGNQLNLLKQFDYEEKFTYSCCCLHGGIER